MCVVGSIDWSLWRSRNTRQRKAAHLTVVRKQEVKSDMKSQSQEDPLKGCPQQPASSRPPSDFEAISELQY